MKHPCLGHEHDLQCAYQLWSCGAAPDTTHGVQSADVIEAVLKASLSTQSGESLCAQLSVLPKPFHVTACQLHVRETNSCQLVLTDSSESEMWVHAAGLLQHVHRAQHVELAKLPDVGVRDAAAAATRLLDQLQASQHVRG